MSTVERLLAEDKLEADPSAGWTGLTYVTRESLAQYQVALGKDAAAVWALRRVPAGEPSPNQFDR